MNRLLVVITAIAVMIGGGVVSAQERTETTKQTPYVRGGWTGVEFEGATYRLDPAVPEQAYVRQRLESFDATTVELVYFRRGVDGIEPSGSEWYEATGVLTNARVGDRLALVNVGN